MRCTEFFIGNTLHAAQIPVRVLTSSPFREGGENSIGCKTLALVSWSSVCAVVAVPKACTVVAESPNKTGFPGLLIEMNVFHFLQNQKFFFRFRG